MYEADRQNDPLKFENNYYETVYSQRLQLVRQNQTVMPRHYAPSVMRL